MPEICLNEKELGYLNLVPTHRESYMTGGLVKDGGNLEVSNKLMRWMRKCNHQREYVCFSSGARRKHSVK